MVTKMESETQVLLDELNIKLPNVTTGLNKIYGEFYADAKELTKDVMHLNYDADVIAKTKHLNSEEKIALFTKLKQNQKECRNPTNQQRPQSSPSTREAV